MNSSGLLAGTPSVTAAGATFTVLITDSAGASATQAFTLTIIPGSASLTITTPSPLPGGSVGAGYSEALTAAGGKLPYSWSITTGALPDGLKLDPGSGAISGTPTTAGSFTFNVRVTDNASATADQLTSITVVVGPAAPLLTLTDVPTSVPSALQVPFDVTLSAPFVSTVSGQVALTFQPDAAVSRDDPAIQFSSGGRTVSFTIPAGSTHAVFPTSPMAFQTGTLAGTLTFTVTSNLPGGATTGLAVVPQAAPVIRSVTVVTNASGFQVQIAAFSNSRELEAVSFYFTAKSGQILQTSDFTADLASLASQWYSGDASTPFGGQFLLLVPFNLEQGQVSGLASVTVHLQNGRAASSAVTANF